jgi:hypothetical protein
LKKQKKKKSEISEISGFGNSGEHWPRIANWFRFLNLFNGSILTGQCNPAKGNDEAQSDAPSQDSISEDIVDIGRLMGKFREKEPTCVDRASLQRFSFP